MARIRSIKPEFWKSQSIADLKDWRDRLTFIGLWSYVDDNGVGVDSFKLIAAELYGLEDDPREVRDHTRECLARLAAAGFITRYTHDGKRYIHVTTWDKHQRIDRPNKPRYPLPTDRAATVLNVAQAAEMDLSGVGTPVVAVDDSRNTRESVASVHRLEQRNRGTGEKELSAEQLPDALPLELPPVDAKPKRATTDTAAFDRWWSTYPRKVGKGDARKAWVKAAKLASVDVLVAAAERYRDDPVRKRAEPQFTKHPATWLNGECWHDEPDTAAAPQQRTPEPAYYRPLRPTKAS